MEQLLQVFQGLTAQTAALTLITIAIIGLTHKFFPKLYASATVYVPYIAGCAAAAVYAAIFQAEFQFTELGMKIGTYALIAQTAFNRLSGKETTVTMPTETRLITVTGILSGLTDLENAKSLAKKIVKQLDSSPETEPNASFCQNLLRGSGLNKSEKELLNISCIILSALSITEKQSK